MAENVYEGMFLLDSGKTGGDWDAASNAVRGILERHNATLLASRPWDERQLAFPVKGHKRGMYLLTYFKVDGQALTEIDQDCKLNEQILRQLVLRVEPKLVDQLVGNAMKTASSGEDATEDKAGGEKANKSETPA